MVKDCIGQEIKVGSIIVYPGRRSSSMWMNKAIVRDMVISKDWRGRDKDVLYIETVSYSWSLQTYKLVKTKIERIERVTVVGLSEEEFMKLLEGEDE